MIYFDEEHNAYGDELSIIGKDIVFSCENDVWADCNNNHGKYEWVNNELVLNPNWEQEQAEEAARKEAERIANLNLTKADFWIALLDREITKAMVKEKVELIPDAKLRAKTLIRIDEADHFWRGDPAMDIIGAMFGLTSEDLTYLFEHKELPEKEV